MLTGYMNHALGDAVATDLTSTLRKAGCETVLAETISNGRWSRPALHQALQTLLPGDTIVVPHLGHLATSLSDLAHILERISDKEIHLRSLSEKLDTNSQGGRMLMDIVRNLTKFDRDQLRRRTQSGFENAQQEGRATGRPPKLTPDAESRMIARILAGEITAADAARQYGLHRATVTRKLRRHLAKSGDGF